MTEARGGVGEASGLQVGRGGGRGVCQIHELFLEARHGVEEARLGCRTRRWWGKNTRRARLARGVGGRRVEPRRKVRWKLHLRSTKERSYVCSTLGGGGGGGGAKRLAFD